MKYFSMFSNIAKVLDMPEYYKQYPDRIPTPVKEFPLATKEPLEEYGTSEGALNGITKGLQKFLDKNPKAENANGLLIDAKKRLRNLEEGVK